MAVTAARLAQGQPLADYVAQMGEYREKFLANYEAVTVPPAACAQVRALGPLHVLIITENSCSDSLAYLPTLMRLADCAGTWDLRVFQRDENLDLLDQYLNEGKWRSVPVVAFFDAQMRELGHFIERPAQVNRERQVVIDHVAATTPAVRAGLPAREQSEEAKLLLALPLRDLRLARLPAWREAMIDEVCAILAGAHSAV